MESHRRHHLVPVIASLAILTLVMTVSPSYAEKLSEQFYGSYVGSGTAQVLASNKKEKRDLDVTIVPYKQNGFTLKWITVVRDAKGQRTGDGIKRREVEENFLPLEGRENIFLLAPEGGLFKRAELPNPLRGEPMRWATVKDHEITIYSIAIDDSGKSETQVYRRVLTKKGMSVSYLRLEDETIIIKLTGTLSRTK